MKNKVIKNTHTKTNKYNNKKVRKKLNHKIQKY